ncbi:unnamed protein product [Rhodiola kirilowii]
MAHGDAITAENDPNPPTFTVRTALTDAKPYSTIQSTASVSALLRKDEEAPHTEKDPRKIARRYQIELCKKALTENIIVYLGTGCGKTHIAVLLIYEMGHLIRKPQKKICVFLATTVALVEQQSKVIKDSIDFKVGTFCGGTNGLRSHHDWEKEIQQCEVFVMTPQILLRNLNHCFIKMELIALLIFDECHHAQAQSNHPYAEIMKVFYDTNVQSRPRIFGMTASPIVGKGASNHTDVPKCINSLENMLDSKIYTVEKEEELKNFFKSPKVKIYHYGPVANTTSKIHLAYRSRLEDIKCQSLSMLSQNRAASCDLKSLQLIKKSVLRVHGNLIFCLENLGLWGALQACQIFSSGDMSEQNERVETEVNFEGKLLRNRYISQATSILSADCAKDGVQSDLSCTEVLKEPLFSEKLLRLLGILSNFRLQKNMKCIIFVNRIIVARSLSYILQNLKFLASWKCNFLVGVHSGLKSVTRQTLKKTVDMFRSDQLNLLIATKVGEEGLDIQTCCLVIRFDLPETVASFIQSRGRARMPHSEYAILVDSGNQKEVDLVKNFTDDEDRMNNEIVTRSSREAYAEPLENLYRVDSSGACITAGYSVSLLHQYCSKLPHDEYFIPKPEFYFFDDIEGTICHLLFPANAPINQIVSSPQPSIEAAKKDASLRACKELHKLGIFNDYLLPNKEVEIENMLSVKDGPNCSDDEDSKTELHEMQVPSALAEPFNNSSELVRLHSYFVDFIPAQNDRMYKAFGLFIKKALPVVAQTLKIDLHLSHGRSVITEFISFGFIEFNKEKILQALKFQEMYLKVILERSQFFSEHVCLGRSDKTHSRVLTSYLLLPIINQGGNQTLTIDWPFITRCLSSPIFKSPVDKNGVVTAGTYLKLIDGVTSVHDIMDSLVFVPYKKAFFFVCGILHYKNGWSPHIGQINIVEHYFQEYHINLLHPEQPLLKAKQLFCLHNLLCDRGKGSKEPRELEEHFFEIPPELCQLKIMGFSKEMGSSLSLLPSVMYRLESVLVAAELKQVLSSSFAEGSEVTVPRLLEALTTEKCNERISLERLEVLGDAFLKFVVGRHLFLKYAALDEGQLTRMRSNAVSNSNLYKLAIKKNLQIYIRDQPFDPSQFYAPGHPCSIICSEETKSQIHSRSKSDGPDSRGENVDVRCNRGHQWLFKKTIADVVEALIGAFVIDSGFKAAISFLKWIGIEADYEVSQVTDICIQSKRYLQLNDLIDVDALEKKLGYNFVHKGLLVQAFLHPSYNRHGGGCYQRLEFLGDSVLDYMITSYLYSAYPSLKPGHMTDLRSLYVNNKAFADVSISLSFHKFIISDSSSLNKAVEKYVVFSEIPDPGEYTLDEPKFPKVLGDLMESCVGAILLDTGLDLAYVWRTIIPLLETVMRLSSFRLVLSGNCKSFASVIIGSWNSPLKRWEIFFSVEAVVTGKDVSATTCVANRSRKDGMRNAAQQVCTRLKDCGYVSKCKSLEEVVKSSCKMEAKLIGYDEASLDIIAPDIECRTDSLWSSDIDMEESVEKKLSKLDLDSGSGLHIRRLNQGPSSLATADHEPLGEYSADNFCDADLKTSGISSGKYIHRAFNSSQFIIVEVVYTFKVVLEIVEARNMVIECTGLPCLKKKAAVDSAAEGTLWYLKQEKYLPSATKHSTVLLIPNGVVWDREAKHAGIGAIARDDYGVVLSVKGSFRSNINSILDSEGAALQEAFLLAYHNRWTRIIFETVNWEFVQCVKFKTQQEVWHKEWFIYCSRLLLQINNWQLNCIRREANRTADAIARRCRLSAWRWSCLDDVPYFSVFLFLLLSYLPFCICPNSIASGRLGGGSVYGEEHLATARVAERLIATKDDIEWVKNQIRVNRLSMQENVLRKGINPRTRAQQLQDLRQFKGISHYEGDEAHNHTDLPCPGELLVEEHYSNYGEPWAGGRDVFEFLAEASHLKLDSRVLEIGCGTLRVGLHFIRYLNPGNFHCPERDELSLMTAFRYELPAHGLLHKRPLIVRWEDMDLSKFGSDVQYDLIYASAAFLHMPDKLVWVGMESRLVSKLIPYEGRIFVSHNIKFCSRLGEEECTKRLGALGLEYVGKQTHDSLRKIA